MSERRRRARAGVRSTLWEKARPVLGWTLAALLAALFLSTFFRTFRAASSANDRPGFLTRRPLR